MAFDHPFQRVEPVLIASYKEGRRIVQVTYDSNRFTQFQTSFGEMFVILPDHPFLDLDDHFVCADSGRRKDAVVFAGQSVVNECVVAGVSHNFDVYLVPVFENCFSLFQNGHFLSEFMDRFGLRFGDGC
jgi:hypothetical protein